MTEYRLIREVQENVCVQKKRRGRARLISAKIMFGMGTFFRSAVGMNALDEDWNIGVSMLPPSWQGAARWSGCEKRLLTPFFS